MSLVVTSFCKSTKAAPLPPCTHQSGVASAEPSPPTGGMGGTEARKAQIARGLRAEPRAVVNASARERCPAAAPATSMPFGFDPGTKAASDSCQTGLPPRWQVRCSVGFQPLETASRSQAISVSTPLSSRTMTLSKLLAASRLLHHGAGKDRPRSCASAFRCPFRGSTTAATATPLAARIARRGPAIVGSGEHHGARARRHAEAVEIAPHRRPKHHARQIVAGKGDAALDSAGGKHGALRHDVPGALARLMLRRHRHIVGNTLHRAIGAAVIDAEDRWCAA